MGKQHHGTAAKRAADMIAAPAGSPTALAAALAPDLEAAAPGGGSQDREPAESKTWTSTKAEGGGVSSEKPLCESPQVGSLVDAVTGVDVKLLEPWLWLPVSLGGGDVAMLCKFTESQIQLLRVKAEEQNISEGEILSEALARMFEHAWL